MAVLLFRKFLRDRVGTVQSVPVNMLAKFVVRSVKHFNNVVLWFD